MDGSWEAHYLDYGTCMVISRKDILSIRFTNLVCFRFDFEHVESFF